MTDLLLAIFYVDIEQCTLALLLHVLPGYLQYRLDEISLRDDSSELRHYFFVKESSRFFFFILFKSTRSVHFQKASFVKIFCSTNCVYLLTYVSCLS